MCLQLYLMYNKQIKQKYCTNVRTIFEKKYCKRFLYFLDLTVSFYYNEKLTILLENEENIKLFNFSHVIESFSYLKPKTSFSCVEVFHRLDTSNRWSMSMLSSALKRFFFRHITVTATNGLDLLCFKRSKSSSFVAPDVY